MVVVSWGGGAKGIFFFCDTVGTTASMEYAVWRMDGISGISPGAGSALTVAGSDPTVSPVAHLLYLKHGDWTNEQRQ